MKTMPNTDTNNNEEDGNDFDPDSRWRDEDEEKDIIATRHNISDCFIKWLSQF